MKSRDLMTLFMTELLNICYVVVKKWNCIIRQIISINVMYVVILIRKESIRNYVDK